MPSSHDQSARTGQAVSLAWPQSDVALATMIREREMNTLSLELLDELDAALTESVSAGARALIVTGQGRAFCAGAHLRYFTQPDPRIGAGGFALRDNYLRRIAELFDRIETLPIPVVAAINGFALGGGCELSLACDLRVMADNTRIGVPETRIGALAGAGGVQKLHRFVGRGKALEWVMLGSHVTAEEALGTALSPRCTRRRTCWPRRWSWPCASARSVPAPSRNPRHRCGFAATPISRPPAISASRRSPCSSTGPSGRRE